MQVLNVRLTGIAGTILHNGQMADPLNKFAKALKAISGKRKKTDDDYAAMAQIEFMGSIYLTADGKPGWPGENIEAMLLSAAKKQKEGQVAKMAIFVDGVCPLRYKGPTDPEVMWLDEQFRIVAAVKVGTSRVMRTRPIIRQWSLDVPIQFDPALSDESQVFRWVEIAGQQIGLSDWRPRYGRFTAEKI